MFAAWGAEPIGAVLPVGMEQSRAFQLARDHDATKANQAARENATFACRTAKVLTTP